MEKGKKEYDYDFFIIGGGPGGIAAAKEASKYNIKIGLADFVKPSPYGSTWGLGGTCVNVGCIPKKMMHFSGLLFDQTKFLPFVGYPSEINKEFSWEQLTENVKNHISGLNFSYKKDLKNNKITYYNKYARFRNPHTIELEDDKGEKETITANKILVATGLRPSYPADVPGAEKYCITSDDIFSLKKEPGKTLIIGASYIAIECASFLKSFGYDVTMMVRSVILRGFDQDMAKRVRKTLEKEQINFLDKCIPVKFSKAPGGKVKCEYKSIEKKPNAEEDPEANPAANIKSEIYDTVLLATGRKADLTKMNIEYAGVKISKSGKIIVDANERTNMGHIYAIGDIAEGRPELAPPAIMAGKLLSQRLFGKGVSIVDYNNIPTTVYGKIEYSYCGLTEEGAIEKYGKNFIKVYHSEFIPTEWKIDPKCDNSCYIKVIVNILDQNRVVGFHVFAPHAGEIIQGIAVAMRCGLTKDKLDETVGIASTIAENITTLENEKKIEEKKKPKPQE